MKIFEIIEDRDNERSDSGRQQGSPKRSPEFEAEANALYMALASSPDQEDQLIAYYFQTTRNNVAHKTVDSAQRAAERLAKKALKQINAQGGKKPINTQQELKQYSDKFRGNQYVKIGRDKLPNELKAYLPIIDQGISKAFTSGWQAGKNLSKLFDPANIKAKGPKNI